MGTLHLAVLLLALHQVTAQRAPDQPGDDTQSNIINGEDADKHEFPFMVRMLVAETMSHRCGGVLLSPKVVITAAHCVVDHDSGNENKFPPEMFRLVVGDHVSSDTEEENEQVVEPMRILVHEDYRLDDIGAPIADIAIMILKEEVTLKDGIISTIGIADNEEDYNEGTDITIIGWGIDKISPNGTYTSEYLADTLQKLEYKITKNEDCYKYWDEELGKANYYGVVMDWNLEEIAGGMFCGYDPEKTPYRGDSGGPIVKNKQGNEDDKVLVGLVSWGTADPNNPSYNIGVKLSVYKDWINAALSQADAETWVEILGGGSHGPVMVHHKNGETRMICKDDVGRNEVGAICREQGYKLGQLASVSDYQTGGRRRKNQDPSFPPFGYTKLSCKADAKVVMADCEVKDYTEAAEPCFDGDQVAVQCTDEAWELRVTHMITLPTKPLRGTEFVKGGMVCLVKAHKYGKVLDMRSQVQVGLLVRREGKLQTIRADMKYKKKEKVYLTKWKRDDEVKADDCFSCIAYLPGTKFYSVGEIGPGSCPKGDGLYEKWLEELNEEN